MDAIRGILSRGGTPSSECLEWGIKPHSADFYIHEAKQQIVQDFDIDRREYTAQLLQVLQRTMEKGTETNQMGEVTAAVAQAMKLARLDG